MKAAQIASVIEAFAPLATQESWDNAGFCIGNPDAEVHGVMVGFDCTPALLRAAVAKGADMVVTHHPLIFSGLKRLDPADPVGEAIFLAIRHGVTVYAAHTNADKADGGVNALMAERMGMEHPEAADDSGLVFVGDLPAPMSGEAFCAYVKERFSLKLLRCSAPVAEVRRVATSCGSGSSFAEQAFRAGAQAFVTGDVSYHRFAVPEGRMIVDIGHWESEVEIVSKFVSLLQKKLPNFAVYTAMPENNNPIYYY